MPHQPDYSHPSKQSFFFFCLLFRDPAIFPNPYQFKEFIPAARKPGSLQRAIHITFKHSLLHSSLCKEHYCPYHCQ